MVLLASDLRSIPLLQSRRSQERNRLKIKNVTEEKMADGAGQAHRLVHQQTSAAAAQPHEQPHDPQAAFGDDVDGWPGKIIVLYPTTAEFRGKMGPAMRVRIPPPKDSLQGTGVASEADAKAGR